MSRLALGNRVLFVEPPATLRSLGAEVIDVSLPPLADYQACTRVIIVSEAFAIHRHNLVSRPDLYAAVTRYRLMPGALVSADVAASLAH